MLMSKRSKRLNQTSKNKLQPGIYNSVVKNVEFCDDYKDSAALKVSYELCDESGKIFEFSEIFYLIEGNERTIAFDEYLDSAGFDDYFKFEGCKESVDLKWHISHNRRYLSIADRKMLGVDSSK
ncbi:MAG: hypothetical protein E7395_03695 [Ruminococcaceae bacterium]|nr:hypothetical protein [Oscillospiraceae bacterium]